MKVGYAIMIVGSTDGLVSRLTTGVHVVGRANAFVLVIVVVGRARVLVPRPVVNAMVRGRA